MKKLFLPLIVLLISGCYNNPFLADTYREIIPSEIQDGTQEKAHYTIRHYQQSIDHQQSTDLKSYELKDEETKETPLGTEVTAVAVSYEGFTFDETNPQNVKSGVVTADGGLVLKLYYNRNKLIVTFDKNSETATGEMEPQTFYYGDEFILKKSSYKNGENPFIGWAVEPSANAAVKYEDGATLDFDLSAGGGELTLYALYGGDTEGDTEAAQITKLSGKITGATEDLSDDAVIHTARNITVNFETNEYAVKGSWQCGDLTGDISNSSVEFSGLKDGNYTFKIQCENKDGVKSEEKTFSWTIAADVKLKVSGKPNSVIGKGATVNIGVTGDNLESCFYTLNDGSTDSSADVELTDGAGKIDMTADTVGDFRLTITGKNILDETSDEIISWKVVEYPIAELSGVIEYMEIGTTQNITVGDCKYYKYKINDGEWSAVYPVDEKIAIKNEANSNNSYTIEVIGGNTETFSDDLLWQPESEPTRASWKVYPVYGGELLGTVLQPGNKVSGDGVSGKNIYATYDDNFIYFGYESQTSQNLSVGNNALCIAMRAGGDTRSGIKPIDLINEQDDNSQPGFELSNEPVSHFLKISFDTAESGTAKFFGVKGGNWRESASIAISFEIHKDGKCVVALPREILASPDSEIKYVIYMRCYDSKTIYAVYPKESEHRNDETKPVYTNNIAVMKIEKSAE